jgi:peptidoglycan/xylan/chitin deacetylase (PgdA/CDA1 family)
VLCYHAVADEWEHHLAVRQTSFEQHVRSLLRRGFRPRTVVEALGSGGRSFHITFDDAFRNVVGALTLLRTLGVPATVFVCADLADDGSPLPVAALPSAPREHWRTMTWDELRAIADEGVEVGSHTCGHPHLTRVGDAELRRELGESRERIEAELGRPCRLLAYPFGEHDARVRTATKAAGYTVAFAQGDGPRTVDLLALPRVSVYRVDTPARVRFKLTRLGREAAALKARWG